MLGFIQNHEVPFFSSKHFGVLNDYFIASNANMEAVKLAPTLSFEFSFFGRAKIRHNFKCWTPSFKFYFPIHENASGNNY